MTEYSSLFPKGLPTIVEIFPKQSKNIKYYTDKGAVFLEQENPAFLSKEEKRVLNLYSQELQTAAIQEYLLFYPGSQPFIETHLETVTEIYKTYFEVHDKDFNRDDELFRITNMYIDKSFQEQLFKTKQNSQTNTFLQPLKISLLYYLFD